MYGAATLGYGNEAVFSFNSLVDAIKRFQLVRPRCKLAMKIGDAKIQVNLLSNGFIELDGKVQPVAIEREIEDVIAQYGAILEEVRLS